MSKYCMFATGAITAALMAPTASASFVVGGLDFYGPTDLIGSAARSSAEIAAWWGKDFIETPASVNPAFGGPYVPGSLAGENIAFLYGFQDGDIMLSSPDKGFDVFVGTAYANFAGFDASNPLGAPADTPASLKLDAANAFADFTDVSVTVNGVDFETATGLDLLTDFRTDWPPLPHDPSEYLSATCPLVDCIYEGFDPGFAGYTFPFSVTDGAFLVVKNIPHGVHELVVSATTTDGSGDFTITQRISVPEPASLALFGAGALAGFGFARRRRNA